MDLQDETCETFDYALVPTQVRAALVAFWDDNESERANIDLICHWLSIANDRKTNAIARQSRQTSYKTE
jgi:hypothetical protein